MPLITPRSKMGLALLANAGWSDSNVIMSDGIAYFQEQPDHPFDSFYNSLERVEWAYRTAARLGFGYVKDWAVTPKIDRLYIEKVGTNWLSDPPIDMETMVDWAAIDLALKLSRQYQIITSYGFPKWSLGMSDLGGGQTATSQQILDYWIWPYVDAFLARYSDYHDVLAIYLSEEPISPNYGVSGNAITGLIPIQTTLYNKVKAASPQMSVHLPPTFIGAGDNSEHLELTIAAYETANADDKWDIASHHTTGIDITKAEWDALTPAEKLQAASVVPSNSSPFNDASNFPVGKEVWNHEFSMGTSAETLYGAGERVAYTWKSLDETSWNVFKTAIYWYSWGLVDPSRFATTEEGYTHGGNGFGVMHATGGGGEHALFWSDVLDENGHPTLSDACTAILDVMGAPPLTTLTYFENNSIRMESTDETATIYFTTDGTTPTYPAAGTTQTYSTPIALYGETTIKYFSRTSTETEPVKTLTESPITTKPIVHSEPSPFVSTRHIDEGKTYLWAETKYSRSRIDIKYKVDGGPWQDYTGPFITPVGVLEFVAADQHGNFSLSSPSNATRINNTITITAWVEATIYYRWNGAGAYQVYSSPLTVTDETSLQYYAADAYYTEEAKTLFLGINMTDLQGNAVTSKDLNGTAVISRPLGG